MMLSARIRSGSSKIAIGAKPRGMDAGDGADIVHLVGVAGDADGAHHLAGLVADQLAAAFEKQRIIGEFSIDCMNSGFSFAFCSTSFDGRPSASEP